MTKNEIRFDSPPAGSPQTRAPQKFCYRPRTNLIRPWTRRATLSSQFARSQLTLECGDEIYANRKSFSLLLNCSNKMKVHTTGPIGASRLFGIRLANVPPLRRRLNVSLVKHQALLLVLTLTRFPTDECVTESLWYKSFFQSYTKEL